MRLNPKISACHHTAPTVYLADHTTLGLKRPGLAGLTTQEILRFRNKLGDTPLIYSVKQGEVDIVRFLLLQGADLRVVNNNFQSPIDIAIEKKQINIINAIAEMMPHLLEDRKIDNKESSAMYDWAVKTKENNESQCDKQDD